MRSKADAVSVSPARGRRSTFATKSRLIDPMTVSSGGKGAQVVDRTLEVLAQVEQTGPERRAVGRSVDPSHVREALEGSYEHGQLEVGLGDADRRRGHSGALQHRLPLDQLARAGPAVPGAALRLV